MKHQLLTTRVLSHRLTDYGSKNCLSLAANSGHVNFVSHNACQIKLKELWYGRLILEAQSQVAHGIRVSMSKNYLQFQLCKFMTDAYEIFIFNIIFSVMRRYLFFIYENVKNYITYNYFRLWHQH